jgi:hypothetical protein
MDVFREFVVIALLMVLVLAACAPRSQPIPDHLNPPAVIDDFNEAMPGQPGSPWYLAGIDGGGEFLASQEDHAAAWVIDDENLRLMVFNDESFDSEKSNDGKGKPAPSQYNNVFLVGFRGYAPTQTEDIVISSRMKIGCENGFWGSTGIWMEEQNTFDQAGMGLKDFHAFGFSYLGRSAEGIAGLQFEAVDMGSYFFKHQRIEGINPCQWHTYSMRWGWQADGRKQWVTYSIDDQELGAMVFPAFREAGEVQVWDDNYYIPTLIPFIGLPMRFEYQNIPKGMVQTALYDWVSVEVQPSQ